MDILAVVRIRGVRNMKPRAKKTLELLRLQRPNHCVVLGASSQLLGMLGVVKDYVAFGKVSEETFSALLAKRGEKGAKRLAELMKQNEITAAAKAVFSGKKLSEFADPVFRLHPPRSGYRDIKQQFPRGDLGARSDMDTLIKRMM